MNDVSCFVCFLHTVITLCNQCSVLIFNIWIWTKLVYFPLLNQNPTKSIGAAFLLLFGVTLSLYLLNQILISETIHTHTLYTFIVINASFFFSIFIILEGGNTVHQDQMFWCVCSSCLVRSGLYLFSDSLLKKKREKERKIENETPRLPLGIWKWKLFNIFRWAFTNSYKNGKRLKQKGLQWDKTPTCTEAKFTGKYSNWHQ